MRQYLSYAEETGRALDHDGQVLRYDGELMIALKKRDGIWHVVKVWRIDGDAVCFPVRVWQRVRRGVKEFIARVLIGWRYFVRGAPAMR